MALPLDYMDDFPKSMRRYLDYYGWHFNKASYEFAANLMWKENAEGKREKVQPMTKSEVDKILKDNNVEIQKNTGNWDYMYWAQQAKADLMPGAIDDEKHLAQYIKMMTDDVDITPEATFRKWYICAIGSGVGVPFEEFLD